jgi:hypothetical protein
MTNVQDGSRLYGTRKSLLLAANASALVVCYHLPHGIDDLATEACLSPDYYRLLREGRDDLHPCQGDVWRGFRTGDVAVWLGRAGDEDVGWEEPAQAEAGHGLNVRLRAHSGHVHLLIGYGETDDERCRQLIAEGRPLMYEVATPASTRGRTSCVEGHR